MEYKYIAVNLDGKKEVGELDANTEKEVLDFLRAGKLVPLKIEPLEKSQSAILAYFNRVKSGDIILFTRQLSSMILTGLTLIESLNLLKKQADKPKMKKLVEDLINDVSEGKSFSDALQNHKDVFSPVYISLITAAEEGGLLDKVLSRLADNLEKSDEVKKKVRSALFYPAIIISGVLIVIILMNIFVIPQLGDLYESLDLELPLTTQIVVTSSSLTRTFFPVFIGGIIAGIIFLRKYAKTEAGIRIVDKIKLKTPVFGDIIRLSSFDEISRTLSLLVTSGSSLISAIKISADVSGNYYYRNALLTAANLVEKGAGLSVALENQKVFPPLMIQMVKVGESTGKIDESLLKVSEYFERDLELKVKNLTTAIEPILIIVLGISVAFLIISVITPIYGLISQIQ